MNPLLTDEESLRLFRFLGILLGVAVRTKKPLDLYLSPPVWKQLAGMSLTAEDLEEVLYSASVGCHSTTLGAVGCDRSILKFIHHGHTCAIASVHGSTKSHSSVQNIKLFILF